MKERGFFGKIADWLKEPHGGWLAVLYVVTACAVAGSVCLVVFEISSALSAAVYAVAAVSLGLTVYTVVRIAPRVRKKIREGLAKNPFFGRMLEEYGFRTAVFAVGSFAVSFAYAVFNGVLGIMGLSAWYGALAVYYVLLAAMRGGVLSFHFLGRKKYAADANGEKRADLRAFGICGTGLVLLPLCLSVVIAQTVRGINSFEHPGLTIYVAALYAFYKIVMSVINIFRARRSDELTVRAIRSINLADALVSILALQTAMFREFSPDADAGFANALTGFAVCALTAALGIFMIVRSAFERKKLVKTGQAGERLPQNPTEEGTGEGTEEKEREDGGE